MAERHRTFKEECSFIERLDHNSFLIKKGFVPNMKVCERALAILDTLGRERSVRKYNG